MSKPYDLKSDARNVVRQLICWGAVLLAIWGGWSMYSSVHDPDPGVVIIVAP